jgi:hypothetical protein
MPDGPFYKGARGSMSPTRRARIFRMRDGTCGDATLGDKDWGCGRKLRPPADRWSVEHHPALENGGEDTDETCFVVCERCRKPKDADDHAEAARSRKTPRRAVGLPAAEVAEMS